MQRHKLRVVLNELGRSNWGVVSVATILVILRDLAEYAGTKAVGNRSSHKGSQIVDL